jgi:glycosyltransferase involved in cell wall biosynthesis
VEIIQKYETWLTGWISESDGGQSDAINKGFDRSTGEIIHWLCSDDLLMPGALWNVADAFAKKPECDVVVGHCLCTYEDTPEKNAVLRSSVESIQAMPYLFGVWQPSSFFRRAAVKREKVLRRELHYCMDRELWCRLQACGARWKAIDKTLSSNRFTGDNKSLVGQSKIIQEIHEIYRSYESERVPLTALLLWFWLPFVTVGLKRPPGVARNLLRTASRSVTFGLKRIYPAARVRALQKEFYRYSM